MSSLPSSILDFDLGNSRLKYRCGSQRGAVSYPQQPLPELLSVSRVRVSSVRNAEADQEFAAAVRERYGCECEFASTTSELAGVSNGYQTPDALGVDRWLAAVAGYHHASGAVLVADLGTAATLDYVSAQGVHLGGFIVPGLELMSRALLRDTAAIELDGEVTGLDLAPGRSTDQAVQRGCLLALVRLLDAENERFRGAHGDKSRLLLCGGSAQRVAAALQTQNEVVSDLVLDGLALALP